MESTYKRSINFRRWLETIFYFMSFVCRHLPANWMVGWRAEVVKAAIDMLNIKYSHFNSVHFFPIRFMKSPFIATVVRLQQRKKSICLQGQNRMKMTNILLRPLRWRSFRISMKCSWRRRIPGSLCSHRVYQTRGILIFFITYHYNNLNEGIAWHRFPNANFVCVQLRSASIADIKCKFCIYVP